MCDEFVIRAGRSKRVSEVRLMVPANGPHIVGVEHDGSMAQVTFDGFDPLLSQGTLDGYITIFLQLPCRLVGCQAQKTAIEYRLFRCCRFQFLDSYVDVLPYRSSSRTMSSSPT